MLIDARMVPAADKHGYFWKRRQYGWSSEKAQQITAHESPRTTKLYDRMSAQISLDEIERVVICAYGISQVT